jgi:SAM-dependent methyltransferase
MESEVYGHFFRAEDEHWWFRARRRILATVLEAEFLAGGLTIADVGCGTGGMIALLSRFGEVTGVDEAAEAREYCARRGLQGILTLEEWMRTPGRYDLVTVFDVVEHVEDDVSFLRKLRSRLNPQGRILVTVPAYPFLWSTFDEMNHHKRRYSRGRLRSGLVQAGFAVERCTHFNTLLFPAVALVRLLERRGGGGPTTDAGRKKALDRWFKVGPLNRLWEAVFAAERHWLRRADLLAGTSILALGRNRES